MNQPVPTYGLEPTAYVRARPNRGLELVELELIESSASSRLLYFDQAAAATHAEQVNRALREVDGGQLVATMVRDRYRLVADDEMGRAERLGFTVDDVDVQRRSLQSLVDRGTDHLDPRIQVQTVIEHPWRDFERPTGKVAA